MVRREGNVIFVDVKDWSGGKRSLVASTGVKKAKKSKERRKCREIWR